MPSWLKVRWSTKQDLYGSGALVLLAYLTIRGCVRSDGRSGGIGAGDPGATRTPARTSR